MINKSPARGVELLIVLALALTSCFGGGGVYHTVKKGETLWRISRTYDVKMERVIRANHIRDPRDINIGARLFIPGADKARHVPAADVKRPSGQADTKKSRAKYRGGFLWPVKGRIMRSFGVEKGIRNDGIDIKVREDTAIKAAREGHVVYVGDSFSTYGRIIIIKHPHDIYTVYANNINGGVSKGDDVKKGEVIARAGPGESKEVFVHFEVREGKVPVNPLFFLP